MKMDLPNQVKWIIEQLESAGYEAFAVGGCVRDTILGRLPMDWDITTIAEPDQVKSIFLKTVDTGIEHGTVTVIKQGKGYEVTTYRIDGSYEDNRHPKEVVFTSRLEEDLKRRDFTINAMAYSEKKGLIDCYGGVQDLKNGTIRCVGDPEERFNEDALRILRAFRFSSQLDFDIERNTYEAGRKLAQNLNSISIERIAGELVKLLMGYRPQLIQNMYDMGVFDIFYQNMKRPDDKLINYIKAAPYDKIMKLSALLIKDGEENAVKVLRALKLDNESIKTVSLICNRCAKDMPITKTQIRTMMFECGNEISMKIIKMYETMAKADSDALMIKNAENAAFQLEKIIKDGDCTSLKTLAVSGYDIIKSGIKPGQEVGRTLNYLMQLVLNDPQLNTKEQLISILLKKQT